MLWHRRYGCFATLEVFNDEITTVNGYILAMENFKQLVFPVYSTNYEEGCGFFVGSHFFTSGHVVSNAKDPFIIINGCKVNLVNPILYKYDSKDSSGFDLAIYKVADYVGPLELYYGTIDSDMNLISVSYRKLGEEYIECRVDVKDFEGNYFIGLTDKILKSGSSGSPVLLGNKVVGVMTAGNNNGDNTPCNPNLPINLCMFLSSNAIFNILKDIKL